MKKIFRIDYLNQSNKFSSNFIMKFGLFIIFIFLISCLENPSVGELLKYTQDDLIPLNDSTKSLYYNDAAFIEFSQMVKDSVKRYEQVSLNKENIMIYYNDLLNIYNYSYSISNTFFENVSGIHTFAPHTLYYLCVSVDTNKIWVKEWLNENVYTNIAGIDSLIENYDIEIFFNYESHGGYNFRLKTRVPINYFALKEKFKKTNEFIYVESNAIIGGGSTISLISEDYNIYKYALGWGDCPSGCIYSHYWIIKVTDREIKLLKEHGDPLR